MSTPAARLALALGGRLEPRPRAVRGKPGAVAGRVLPPLLVGVVLLVACALTIWALGGGSAVARSAALFATLGAATMVVVTTLRQAPRAAWSWTLVTVLGCVVVFAIARPALVGG